MYTCNFLSKSSVHMYDDVKKRIERADISAARARTAEISCFGTLSKKSPYFNISTFVDTACFKKASKESNLRNIFD